MVAETTAQKNGKGAPESVDAIDDALTLDEFLAGGKPKMRLVPTPEFKRPDGTIPKVLIRALTAGEQDQVGRWSSTQLHVDERTVETQSAEQTRARVLSWCVLDLHTEKPIFTPKHIFELQNKDASVVSRWYAVVLALSAVDQKEIDA